MFFQFSCDTLNGVLNPLTMAKNTLRRMKISRFEIVYIEEEVIRDPQPGGWPFGEYRYTITVAPTLRTSIPIFRNAMEVDGSSTFVEVADFDVPEYDHYAAEGERVGVRRRWGTDY